MPSVPSPLSRYRGCLLGLATGDAVGTTVEFRPRGTFEPVTDLVGGGPFGLPAGAWTDDTSMALCLAHSLLACDGFDAADQMARYLRWRDEGYLSSTGACFDIGNTVRAALERYRRSGNPVAGSTEPRTAGNGSIMRLAPVVLFYHPDRKGAPRYAAESSLTTHGAATCLDACRFLALVVLRALDGAGKPDALAPPEGDLPLGPEIGAIAAGSFRQKPRDAIRGSGYVVESLEAALWCVWHTDSFEGAVLAAANLGDDADTTAAVVGQIAGALYGEDAIPAPWLERLVRRDAIASLAEALYAKRPPETA
jgi:ADP-ribosyl-[dinitrogen reductase] hydrolase